jgi:penicillin amidase
VINWLKRITLTVIVLIILLCLTVYLVLQQSLPSLDGQRHSPMITQQVNLQRDDLGQAVITASNRNDAFFVQGYAHAQDRFFQMDLQRRVAAGTLSEWVGTAALTSDKNVRIHQFSQRAKTIFASLPDDQKLALQSYTAGVNLAIQEYRLPPFEYLITGFHMQPWQPEDSLLVIFSMYLDLQQRQVARDLALTRLKVHFGQPMVDFILQSSHHQAALDGSQIENRAPIPQLKKKHEPIKSAPLVATLIPEMPEIGSNNWAVDGQLTTDGSALLAGDMHLGLRIPTTWYRTQLNYPREAQNVQVTGASLPGAPGIIVGTNGHIAWSFTNGNFDNVDWVKLQPQTPLTTITEMIPIPGGEHEFSYQMSPYGPVKSVQGDNYALTWVAHQPYAINLHLYDLDTANTIFDALPTSRKLAIPQQNLVLADSTGNIAWVAAGAITARSTPSNTAIDENAWSSLWQQKELEVPMLYNPKHHRIWTANNRVIGRQELTRFGDGGYANGARAEQIRDRLFESDSFDENAFYAIQLDNEARFLTPWHELLSQVLEADRDKFATDLIHLQEWQACACADSVGYTLVRSFRQQVIAALFAPLANQLKHEKLSLSPVVKHLEPALWQLIHQQPESWLPDGFNDWSQFLQQEYVNSKERLQQRYGNDDAMASLAWGKVNTLAIEHPFAKQIPLLGSWLNMPQVAGYGDTFMPAVQAPHFGASERLFVRPGQLESAIMTLPGGQSGHPLSPYYHRGFNDFANQKHTPLLPRESQHTMTFIPE